MLKILMAFWDKLYVYKIRDIIFYFKEEKLKILLTNINYTFFPFNLKSMCGFSELGSWCSCILG
jgi:hypothetical protein